jgi:nucleoside-diphosphate-sugar epimerase
MTDRIAIFGYGPVGRATAARLIAEGREVIVERRLPQRKAAVFVGSPGVLHDYAYVPDIARATTTLLAAPDSAFGQAWHMPARQPGATRDLLQIAADALNVKSRISVLPAWMLGPGAIFSPFLRELKEMRFQWDRPYQVDASRFEAAFWSDVTPFETGVSATALAYRDELSRRR